MANTIAQKLKIKEKTVLRTVNAPADFETQLGSLPEGVKISATVKQYDQMHWFVLNKMQLEKEMDKVLGMVTGNVVCYVYYPKGTSKMQTDLTRDKGWEGLLAKGGNLTWINLVSFDDTWSTFGFRLKTDADRRKESKPRERPIADHIDAVAKTVRLPEDLAAALKKSKKATAMYDSISFSNKKEYVEWVISAKREETRLQRVSGTIERLEKGWKNPQNS